MPTVRDSEMLIRRMLCIIWSLLICALACAAEEPKKDAAESVGEGNAARWLEYYRRERGQHWDRKAGEDSAGKPQAAPPAPEPSNNNGPPKDQRR
jgi:hypothetical protein